MRLDLEELEDYPTDKIPGFRERIEALLPTMVKHECSEQKYGGFLIRVERGTWMGHVIEHIALEIQTLAGMFSGYGRTRSTHTRGIYNVVFAFVDEEAGRYAAEAGVRIAEALIAGEPYDIDADIRELKAIGEKNALGATAQILVDEAKKRDIPWMRVEEEHAIQIGYGANQVRIADMGKTADPDASPQIIAEIFTDEKPARIPIIAITGTNGKTSTTRLLSHIIKNEGFTVGFTTTDGIYVNNILQEKGDNTGPISAKQVLQHTGVDFAVLETARGGILRSGLGFDKCDVGIITNIKEDHLGLNDIHDLDDLAKVKGVVARSVNEDGWAVLNADDEHCVKIAADLDCYRAFFSMEQNNPVIAKRIAKGKTVAVVKDGWITIKKGSEVTKIVEVATVPVTLNGKLKFMIANVLAATLGAYVYGIPAESIKQALQTFTPDYESMPGRMNLFTFNKFKVLVDYAHNPHGVAAVEDYVNTLHATRKIGIISGVGDRRDEDIIECAKISARFCDHIIIRKKLDMRGRTQDNVSALLLEGIHLGKKDITHEIVLEETDAIKHAMAIAGEGDLIIALTDEITTVVEIIKEQLENEKGNAGRMNQSA